MLYELKGFKTGDEVKVVGLTYDFKGTITQMTSHNLFVKPEEIKENRSLGSVVSIMMRDISSGDVSIYSADADIFDF